MYFTPATYAFGDNAIVFAVEEERVENGNVCGVPHGSQVRLADLEGCGILLQQLPYAIKEEQKHRGGLDIPAQNMAHSIGERVTHGNPIFLDEGLETVFGTEEGIQNDLGQTGYDTVEVLPVA